MVRSSHIFRVHTTTYPSNPKPQLNFRPTPLKSVWCLQRQTQRSCSPPSSPAVVSFDFAFLILFAFPGVHFPFFSLLTTTTWKSWLLPIIDQYPLPSPSSLSALFRWWRLLQVLLLVKDLAKALWILCALSKEEVVRARGKINNNKRYARASEEYAKDDDDVHKVITPFVLVCCARSSSSFDHHRGHSAVPGGGSCRRLGTCAPRNLTSGGKR